MDGRFDRFSERARRVLALAQEEAQRLHHPAIGTEHLLLGLVREHDGVAARLLAHMGVELDELRRAVESHIGGLAGSAPGQPGLSAEAKQALELAIDEARRLGHHYVGTEHLLLGLVRQDQGIAAGVLTSFGVQLERLRQITMRPLADSAGSIRRPGLVGSVGPELEALTERARRVLAAAQEEAYRFNHNYVGTEHLLLGLARDADSVAGQVLIRLGIGLDRIRWAVLAIVGRGDREVPGEIGLTPRARKVVDLAAQESRELGHYYIGTEHLLLGLVREGEGIAAGVLESLGLRLEQLREATLRTLAAPTDPGQSFPPLPPAASALIDAGEPAHSCLACTARSPLYFRYCFHCGARLEPRSE